MTEPKKQAPAQPRKFDAPMESQIGSLRLVPLQPEGHADADAGDQTTEIQLPESGLVSKLIDFIKTI